jgi:hypothetical protein
MIDFMRLAHEFVYAFQARATISSCKHNSALSRQAEDIEASERSYRYLK